MPSRVIGIRVDSAVVERLEEIAKRKGKKVSELLKDFVESYLITVESQPEESSSSSSSKIHEILRQFEEESMKYIERLKQFCEEHADIVVTNNPHADYEYTRDYCLWSLRRHAYNTLRIFFNERVVPVLRRYVRDTSEQLHVEKKVYEIINNAVRELYSSPYPPVKPP